MTKSIGLMALLFALSFAGRTEAAPVVLSLQPLGPTSVNVGGTVSYELLLTNPDAVVGAFSLDISFDPGVLQFVPAPSAGAQFGTYLGDPTLGEAIGTAGESSSGILHIDEVSLLDIASLDALQGGGTLPSLLLANVTFEGLGPGVGGLAFLPGSVELSDAVGNLLAAPTLAQPGAVNVVPEPASPALVILALAACVAVSRSAHRAARLPLARGA